MSAANVCCLQLHVRLPIHSANDNIPYKAGIDDRDRNASKKLKSHELRVVDPNLQKSEDAKSCDYPICESLSPPFLSSGAVEV